MEQVSTVERLLPQHGGAGLILNAAVTNGAGIWQWTTNSSTRRSWSHPDCGRDEQSGYLAKNVYHLHTAKLASSRLRPHGMERMSDNERLPPQRGGAGSTQITTNGLADAPRDRLATARGIHTQITLNHPKLSRRRCTGAGYGHDRSAGQDTCGGKVTVLAGT